MNKLTQFVDVQSGLEYTRTSNSWGGIMVDRGSASETFARKRGRQLCDSASAVTFRLPGMWHANISKSKCAAMKNKHLSKCIAV